MKKGMIALDVLVKLLIGLLVLVVVIFAIVILSGKGQNAVEFIKNLLRFGR